MQTVPRFFNVLLVTNTVQVEVNVSNLKDATADFRYMGHLYTFQMSAWKGRGFGPCLSKMVAEYGDGQYGSTDEDGQITATAAQKEAAVLRAVFDVFFHLRQIMTGAAALYSRLCRVVSRESQRDHYLRTVHSADNLPMHCPFRFHKRGNAMAQCPVCSTIRR